MSEATTPDPIDIHVGLRVRAKRKEVGMSQTALADAIGLTFQQIQKYERGFNRISASRMVAIARALGVPPAYFFEELESTDRPKMSEEQRQARALLQGSEFGKMASMVSVLPDPARREAMNAGVALMQAIRSVQQHKCGAGDAKPLISEAPAD